jgi:ribonuclease HII
VERALRKQGFILLIGVDEAGRGALCGPVVAAAVRLGPGLTIAGLDDSKRLSPEVRARLAEEIRGRAAGFGIASASVEEIDSLNILQATFLAMRRAIAPVAAGSNSSPLVLVDGPLPIAGLTLRQKPYVKGDQRSLNIAAASILAKVERDALMERLDVEFPGYGLARHKGYGTREHLEALARLGPSPMHRKSFAWKQ